MSDTYKTLAIIPARGGSKGVPRKNIHILAGRPLIAWTIDAARACSALDRVIVSTDDEEIADVARKYGADVPFLRPSELAQDSTPDLPVCHHALQWLSDHEAFNPVVVVWLRPTAPLRTKQDIVDVVRILCDSNADCVRSVCAVEHHPYWMYRLEGGDLIPVIQEVEIPPSRQQLPFVYRLNGVVDAFRVSSLPGTGPMLQGKMKGYVMPIERSVDIDTLVDIQLAEFLLNKGVQ